VGGAAQCAFCAEIARAVQRWAVSSPGSSSTPASVPSVEKAARLARPAHPATYPHVLCLTAETHFVFVVRPAGAALRAR